MKTAELVDLPRRQPRRHQPRVRVPLPDGRLAGRAADRLDSTGSSRTGAWSTRSARPGRPHATHEVTNQPPPLVNYDASDDPALRAALAAFGAERGPWPESQRARPPGRRRARAGAGQARQREPAEAPHARPLRPPDRRGGVPPGVARPDDDRDRPRPARGPVAGPAARRAPGPRRRALRLGPRRGRPPVPGLDDLRDRPGAAPRPGPGRRSTSRCSRRRSTTRAGARRPPSAA